VAPRGIRPKSSSAQGLDSEAKGDDLVHIGRCEGVNHRQSTFTDCRSYGIKVEAENGPKNIHHLQLSVPGQSGVRASRARRDRTRLFAR